MGITLMRGANGDMLPMMGRAGANAIAQAVGAATEDAEVVLLRYLEESYMMDNPLELEKVKSILAEARGKRLHWDQRSEDGLPCLHLAAMNEASPPEELAAIVTLLLAQGAPATAEDDDGDSALKAVMSLSEECDRNDGGSPSEDTAALKLLHVVAVRALLQCKAQPVGQAEVTSVFAWLRRHIPEASWGSVRKDVEARAGADIVGQAWSSEELLGYLERRVFDERAGVEASHVEAMLKRGAQPDHTQNGATALVLVVLNPYSTFQNLQQTFRLMLEAAPRVAGMRDGFKFTPLQWASDYVNIAQQHGLDPPNPAVLLALMPCVVEMLPDEVDGGACCLKVSGGGQCLTIPPRDAPSTRFLEGERVLCRVEAPGGIMEWEEGVVIGLWYREACWPNFHWGAPYEVKLDIGTRVFALSDHDRIIRTEAKKPRLQQKSSAKAKSAPAPGPGAGGYPNADPKAKSAGPRFQKRQRADGGWEILDSVSGKARPCPAPDSDSDE